MYQFPLLAVWRAGCIFSTASSIGVQGVSLSTRQQYGRAGCIPVQFGDRGSQNNRRRPESFLSTFYHFPSFCRLYNLGKAEVKIFNYGLRPFPPHSFTALHQSKLYNLVKAGVKIIDDDLNPFSPHSSIFLRLSTVQFGKGGSQNIKEDLNPFSPHSKIFLRLSTVQFGESGSRCGPPDVNGMSHGILTSLPCKCLEFINLF